jgi:hypothetical protein
MPKLSYALGKDRGILRAERKNALDFQYKTGVGATKPT